MYPGIISVDDKVMLRLAEQPALLYERSFLRSKRHPKFVTLLANNGGRFQKNEPVARLSVVRVNGD
jgi:hypothetical protein